MLREYDHMKEEIKNIETSAVHQRFQFIYKAVLSYCLECRKKADGRNPKIAEANKGRLSKCAARDSKKLKFIKEQEASGLLSN